MSENEDFQQRTYEFYDEFKSNIIIISSIENDSISFLTLAVMNDFIKI